MKLPVSNALALSLVAAALTAAAIVVGPRVVRGAADEPAVKPIAIIKDIMFTFNAGATSVVGHLKEGFNLTTCDEEGWEALQGRTSMVM